MAPQRNPIATEEQHAFERRGLELARHPAIVQKRKELEQHWLDTVKPNAEMRACFHERAFEEVMFAAIIWSLNQDPLYPGVVTITRLRHELGGETVPGTRWGIDNPDSVYRVIPISGDEEYLIRGRVAENRLTENYFTLWDARMGTVDVLDGKTLELDADGRFEISVDARPAGDRANHIQSSPTALQFYIRDVVMDWETEMINDLSIERLGDPPERPPYSDVQQLEITLEHMENWVRDSIRWIAQADANRVNDFAFEIDRDTDGALRNQIYMLGNFELASDEEALVLDVNLGGAAYFIAPITNLWGTTNFVQERNGSLNTAQSVANADGTYTFVLSRTDPGVHNWLDPSDMLSGMLTLRWAEFEGGSPNENLSVASRVVPLSALRDALPEGTRFVSPDERRGQLEARAQSYAWRLSEN